MFPGMKYLESGEVILDRDVIVVVDPSFEWEMRCTSFFSAAYVPIHLLRTCRLPLNGEIGVAGPWRIVIAPGGIKDKADLPWLREKY